MTKAQDGKLALGYIRVSTEDQADNGCSLPMQREKVAMCCALHDYRLGEVVEDAGFSAKDLRRPGIARLLEIVEAGGVDVVIVYSLSRLSRDVGDVNDLIRRFRKVGTQLVSITESLDTSTAAGMLVVNVLASFGQFQREDIGEKTRDALQAKQARGEKTGGTVPFGYRLAADGVHLEEDPAEQATLRDLQTMRDAGWSWQRIADELNARGITTTTGREWSWQTARKSYKGARKIEARLAA